MRFGTALAVRLSCLFKPSQGDSAMKWKPFSAVGMAFGVAVFVLSSATADGGEHVRSGSATTTRYSPPASVPAPVVRAAPMRMTILVSSPAPQPEKGPLEVNLRGPDGQVRRFPVEGGAASIQWTQVVIRPGQSVTIRWVARR
jgi:hypothetical protein